MQEDWEFRTSLGNIAREYLKTQNQNKTKREGEGSRHCSTVPNSKVWEGEDDTTHNRLSTTSGYTHRVCTQLPPQLISHDINTVIPEMCTTSLSSFHPIFLLFHHSLWRAACLHCQSSSHFVPITSPSVKVASTFLAPNVTELGLFLGRSKKVCLFFSFLSPWISWLLGPWVLLLAFWDFVSLFCRFSFAF